MVQQKKLEEKGYKKEELSPQEIAHLVEMSNKVVLSERGEPVYTYLREKPTSKVFARIPHPFGSGVTFITEVEVINDLLNYLKQNKAMVDFCGPSILIERHVIGG